MADRNIPIFNRLVY